MILTRERERERERRGCGKLKATPAIIGQECLERTHTHRGRMLLFSHRCIR